MEHMENFIMNKLDLDEYNLTSEDFRKSDSSRKKENVEKQKESSPKIAVQSKAHPLVPKLNFQKIFDWREKNNNDNIIMIRISESRILGEDAISEEINDEDGIQKINKKFFAKGSENVASSTRVNELFERKQMIINALNQAYTDDEDDSLMSPKGDEYETE